MSYPLWSYLIDNNSIDQGDRGQGKGCSSPQTQVTKRNFVLVAVLREFWV